jgi:hypothetical protein
MMCRHGPVSIDATILEEDGEHWVVHHADGAPPAPIGIDADPGTLDVLARDRRSGPPAT